MKTLKKISELCGAGEMPEVKSASCSHKGPNFGPPAPTFGGGLKLPVTPATTVLI